MTLNPSDPLTFAVLVAVTVIVIVGFYFAIRELIADAIILADKKREQKQQAAGTPPGRNPPTTPKRGL